MEDIVICCKLFGLAITEIGEKAYGGIKLTVGKTDKNIDYNELAKCVNKENLLNLVGLDCFNAEDLIIITPEDYEKEFANNE